MDRVIYRDYIVNRCFFIYCSLACTSPKVESFPGLTTKYRTEISTESLRRSADTVGPM